MAKRKNGKLEDYKPEPTMGIAARVAHFLKHARDVRPGEWVAYNNLCKLINGYSRMPHMDGLEVQAVRGAIARARQISRTQHGADIVTQAGAGVRMTVGDEDVAEYALPRRVRSFNSTRESLAATAELVDANKIGDQAKATWVRGIKAGVRALQSPDLIRRLLPPKAETPADEPK